MPITSTPLTIVAFIASIIAAPLVGGLLVGLDRIITARMQGRVGPPVLQPFYDIGKLLAKERVTVSSSQDVYVAMYLVFIVIATGLFFCGGNFLLVILLVTLASLFLVTAAFNSRSPFAEVGASREALQVMAYEPMLLLTAAGFYLVYGTFDVGSIVSYASLMSTPAIYFLPLNFIGFVYVLTIKLRKSPFDLSTSEHAHQELVKGVTTEFSGPTLAFFEIAHWFETVLFLGWVGLFLTWGGLVGTVVAILLVLLVYFFEIWVDNNFARVKWQIVLKSAWLVALVLGGVNLGALYLKLLFM